MSFEYIDFEKHPKLLGPSEIFVGRPIFFPMLECVKRSLEGGNGGYKVVTPPVMRFALQSPVFLDTCHKYLVGGFIFLLSISHMGCHPSR